VNDIFDCYRALLLEQTGPAAVLGWLGVSETAPKRQAAEKPEHVRLNHLVFLSHCTQCRPNNEFSDRRYKSRWSANDASDGSLDRLLRATRSWTLSGYLPMSRQYSSRTQVVNLNGMVAESHLRPLLRQAIWFGSSHSSLPLHFPGAQ
jgi:hypothetical protein